MNAPRILTFKEYEDWVRWRAGEGPQKVRDWITMFNCLSLVHTDKSATVTSWFRTDKTFHKEGYAVDFRMHYYTDEEVRPMTAAAVAAGIPVTIRNRGSRSQHWHCGELATLSWERGRVYKVT
jgi:hypothetical protein|tara:strand:- start:9056 stop:9424 length:369 start_codon:yes stop_codon:yes gene_type:complete